MHSPPSAVGGSAEKDAPVPSTAGESSEPLITVRHLTKVFTTQAGQQVEALADVDLSVQRGEFVAIVGPSGCGKTTLLRILSGLIPASNGEVTMAGAPVRRPRSDIGMVFQAPVLLPWRTVLENVLIPVDIRRAGRAKFRDSARRLLELVGLSGAENMYPSELSGGMQQRAAICRALINDPAVLLMDEPFGALDAMTREQMNIELQRIWLESDKTIVFITHSIPEAVFLGDRVVVMSPRPGRLVDTLSINEPRPRTLDFIGSSDFGSFTTHIRRLIMSKGSLD